jgi:hypothetical protein
MFSAGFRCVKEGDESVDDVANATLYIRLFVLANGYSTI